MTLFLNLSEVEVEDLRERARRLGVRPEELAKAAVVDLLNRGPEDLDAAAQQVLRRDRERGGVGLIRSNGLGKLGGQWTQEEFQELEAAVAPFGETE